MILEKREIGGVLLYLLYKKNLHETSATLDVEKNLQ